jgi:hypothetical protein
MLLPSGPEMVWPRKPSPAPVLRPVSHRSAERPPPTPERTALPLASRAWAGRWRLGRGGQAPPRTRAPQQWRWTSLTASLAHASLRPDSIPCRRTFEPCPFSLQGSPASLMLPPSSYRKCNVVRDNRRTSESRLAHPDHFHVVAKASQYCIEPLSGFIRTSEVLDTTRRQRKSAAVRTVPCSGSVQTKAMHHSHVCPCWVTRQATHSLGTSPSSRLCSLGPAPLDRA